MAESEREEKIVSPENLMFLPIAIYAVCVWVCIRVSVPYTSSTAIRTRTTVWMGYNINKAQVYIRNMNNSFRLFGLCWTDFFLARTFFFFGAISFFVVVVALYWVFVRTSGDHKKWGESHRAPLFKHLHFPYKFTIKFPIERNGVFST